MRFLKYGCIALTYLGLAAMIACRFWRIPVAYHWLVLLASTGFVAAAVTGGAYRTVYGRLALAGLALCWVGDMTGPVNFVVGALAFLLAHLFFIGAFASLGLVAKHALPTGACMVLVSAGLLCWLLPHVDSAHVPLVLGYMLAIGAMVASAGGIVTKNKLALVAAVVFYVSDIFVARWKYVDSGSINGLICGPLYYTACVLFAVSAWRAKPANPTVS